MRQVTRDLLRFSRPYRWSLPGLVLLGVVGSLAEGIGIGLMIPLLDMLVGGAPSADAGPFVRLLQAVTPSGGDVPRMVLLGLAIVALIGLKTIILAANLLLATKIAGRMTRDLRMSACRQLLEVGFGFFTKVRQGKLINVLDTQTYRTSEALLWLGAGVIGVCNIGVFMALLLVISWQMSAIALLLLAPAFMVVRRITRLAHIRGEALVEAYSVMAGRILELLSAMRTIRIFGQERAEEDRFAEAADNLYRCHMRSEPLNHLVPPLAELLYVPAFLAVFAYAWYMGIGVSVLLVFLLLLYRMQPPLKRLDQARVNLASLSSGVAEVMALLRKEDKTYVASGTIPIERLTKQIKFEHVTFRYEPGGPIVIKDVSFTICRGSVVAIVGKSGSGKSTLVNLLCRFYDVETGIISVDGKPLATLDLRSWRKRLAFAGQDADLLTGSIRENIIFGLLDASDEDVRNAVELSNAAEFVDKLPKGLDTQVGPRGLRLSGGQRQRIALARALIRRPDILILDEATNAVDDVTEQAIHDAIGQLAGSSTIIIIGHRLSTLRTADRTLVMANGSLIEKGVPDEIL
jgi:subfamily B ATP-binding cassette protein MsbA